MKWLSAGLIFVSLSTVFGLILGMIGRGLSMPVAITSLVLGGLAAAAACVQTSDPERNYSPSAPLDVSKEAGDAPVLQYAAPGAQLSKRAQRRLQKTADTTVSPPAWRYRSIWLWLTGACFLIFAVRSFCWLLYIDGDQLRIQSPNNLGDLALHITYIRNFASGVSFWPDNPIYVYSKLRYPAGIDLFNALLCKIDVDLIRGLVWVGLLASIATFYSFLRWGGAFGIAGFLFNGGIVGFQVVKDFKFLDYQGDKTIAWKSIVLTMFVTQRGLLYAIPAGLLLLWHWREKFFRSPVAESGDSGSPDVQPAAVNAPGYKTLPFWIEVSLYASMPLFHVHTFLALTIVLVFFFLFGDAALRKHTVTLLVSAFVPATFFVWLITDHFHAGSVIGWQPGWVQAVKGDDLGHPFFYFWFLNFGLWAPAVLALVGLAGWRQWKTGIRWGEKLPEDIAFLVPAAAIFLVAFFVKLAPWGWDNLKIIMWAYFIILPFLWRDLIAQWSVPVRIVVCIALFGSGFVSLLGGLAAGRPGYGFASRPELDAVGNAVRSLPAEARFAAFPTYNHPLLLQGRKVVLGYPGHLWTQGFSDYGTIHDQLRELMRGARNWRETARRLRVRYIFWGREEELNYPMSTRPWERTALRIKSDKNWGAIYDLEPATPR